jgi:hypothetical protein
VNSPAAGLRQHLGDRRRQRRLAVVDVTDRPDVAMRLVRSNFSLAMANSPFRLRNRFVFQANFAFMTSSATLLGTSMRSDRTAS